MKILILMILSLSFLHSVEVGTTKQLKIEVVEICSKNDIKMLGYNPDIVYNISYRIVVFPSGERILYTTYCYIDITGNNWSSTTRTETTAVKL